MMSVDEDSRYSPLFYCFILFLLPAKHAVWFLVSWLPLSGGRAAGYRIESCLYFPSGTVRQAQVRGMAL